MRCGVCSEVKKSTCGKKKCREAKAGAVMEVRIPKSKAKKPKLLAICAAPEASESDSDTDSPSEDELDADDELEADDGATFGVGDAVKVWWSMTTPPAWFPGVVEKVTKGKLRVQYPDSGDWQWHDPTEWDVQALPDSGSKMSQSDSDSEEF